jgi:hypothetical protein
MKRFFLSISKTEIRNAIALIYIIMVLAFLYVLAYHPVPDKNQQLVNILGGNIIAGAGLIIGYFFGASKTESDKAKKDSE